MKNCLILFILLMNGFAFGQSAKKLNKQLQAELLLAEKEQDSVYQVFFKKRELLEEARAAAGNQVRGIHSGELIFREIGGSVTQSIFILSRLEVNTKDLFPDGFNPDAFSGAADFIKEYEDALHKTVFFRFVSLEPFFSKGDKVNEQNVMLQGIIGDYRVAVKENESGFLDLQVYMRQLSDLEPRLDTLASKYREWISELESKASLLIQKINAARENYRLNGPEGFSPAYREQFPMIHPLPDTAGVAPAESGYNYEENPVTLFEAPAPKVSVVTDEPAQYPDGRGAMMAYLESNIVYPPSVRDRGISGKVYLRFVVSDIGKISQVQVLKGIENCPQCNNEAIRLVQAMPRWIPAKDKGKAVNSYFNLPVNFEPK